MREPFPPDRGLNLWENARLFGLLNMALADGYVAMVDSKNHYNYWRPITAIQTGDTDGNPDTIGDPTWTSFRPTPPNQDYVSGHAIEGGAGAEVLKQFFGTDEIGFEDCGAVLPAGSTAAMRRRYSARIPASRRRRTRTRIRAFSSGTTSANRSKKAPNMVEKSASAPPTSTCVLCTDWMTKTRPHGLRGAPMWRRRGRTCVFGLLLTAWEIPLAASAECSACDEASADR